MGIFDDIKKVADANEEKVEAAIDKVADVVDERTGGAYTGQVHQAKQFLKDQVGPSDAAAQ